MPSNQQGGIMQSSLFEERVESNETVDNIYSELLEQGKARYPNATFILGTGPTDAEIVIVGESPGPPDVATGKPFSGPSGDLLAKIVAAINVDVLECYLTNVIKFISRGQELHQADFAFFTPFLHRELLAIAPKIIIVLGNTGTRGVLGTKKPITQLRGKVYDFYGIKAVATFNPAYVLRDPTKKREVWEDMKLVRDTLIEVYEETYRSELTGRGASTGDN
jgi:uracil-DNA glycosylase family 4